MVRQFTPVRILEIQDGTSHTLMVAEKRMNRMLLGTKQPDDNQGYTCGFNLDTVRKTNRPPAPDYFAKTGDGGGLFGGPHPNIFNAVFADGSVHPLEYSIDPKVFKNLGNKADGQYVPDF